MKLNELVGPHVLTGVDISVEQVLGWHGRPEDANCVRFALDGMTYSVVEDPEDDYRSSASEMLLTSGPVLNQIPPTEVIARMRLDEHQSNDVLELVDVVTGQVVLAVGTANDDDYYPWFVGEWCPEGLACNHDRPAEARMETRDRL